MRIPQHGRAADATGLDVSEEFAPEDLARGMSNRGAVQMSAFEVGLGALFVIGTVSRAGISLAGEGCCQRFPNRGQPQPCCYGQQRLPGTGHITAAERWPRQP
jgi:hypothetical protein